MYISPVEALAGMGYKKVKADKLVVGDVYVDSYRLPIYGIHWLIAIRDRINTESRAVVGIETMRSYKQARAKVEPWQVRGVGSPPIYVISHFTGDPCGFASGYRALWVYRP